MVPPPGAGSTSECDASREPDNAQHRQPTASGCPFRKARYAYRAAERVGLLTYCVRAASKPDPASGVHTLLPHSGAALILPQAALRFKIGQDRLPVRDQARCGHHLRTADGRGRAHDVC